MPWESERHSRGYWLCWGVLSLFWFLHVILRELLLGTGVSRGLYDVGELGR